MVLCFDFNLVNLLSDFILKSGLIDVANLKTIEWKDLRSAQCKENGQIRRVMRKPTFCICENKDADQRLCFRYTDSSIPPLPNSEISSL